MCRKPKLCYSFGFIPVAFIDGSHLPVLTTEAVIGKKVRRCCENHIKTAVWMFFQDLPHDVKGIFVAEDKVV